MTSHAWRTLSEPCSRPRPHDHQDAPANEQTVVAVVDVTLLVSGGLLFVALPPPITPPQPASRAATRGRG